MKKYIEQFKRFVKRHGFDIWLISMGTIGAAIIACAVVMVVRYDRTLDQVEKILAERQVTTIEEQYPIDIVEPEVEVEETEETAVVEPVEAPSEAQRAVLSNFDISLDTGVQEHIRVLSAEYGVDPELVFAVIQKESTFNASAVGDNGRSLGLMQIQPRWHAERMSRLGVTDLLDPYQNVKVGIDILAELAATGKPIEWVLMAYNGGPSYANDMWAAGEVSGYACTVLSYRKEMAVG